MEMDGNECSICGNHMRSEQGACYKSASCCGIMRLMHNKCAMNYFSQKYSDSDTTFNLEAWTLNQSIQMLCSQCRVDCLFCQKKHSLKNDNIQFVQRTMDSCTHWSFYLPPFSCNYGGCIVKSKANIDKITCSNCINDSKTNVNEKPLRTKSKEGLYEKLSKISDNVNIKYHEDIYEIMCSFKND